MWDLQTKIKNHARYFLRNMFCFCNFGFLSHLCTKQTSLESVFRLDFFQINANWFEIWLYIEKTVIYYYVWFKCPYTFWDDFKGMVHSKM